jgi:hypothetical protein
LGNLATFHSPLGDRALYQTLDYDNAAAKGCIDMPLHGAWQKYFTIRCRHGRILTGPSKSRPNNAQPRGLALAAIEPYISVANDIPENRISSE